MEKKYTTCNSCNNNLINQVGSVSFDCPQCGKHQIARCHHCRMISATYTCPACEFTGPN